MSNSIHEMDEASLREWINTQRSRNPGSLEARMTKSELDDAERLLESKISKRKPSESDEIVLEPEK